MTRLAVTVLGRLLVCGGLVLIGTSMFTGWIGIGPALPIVARAAWALVGVMLLTLAYLLSLYLASADLLKLMVQLGRSDAGVVEKPVPDWMVGVREYLGSAEGRAATFDEQRVVAQQLLRRRLFRGMWFGWPALFFATAVLLVAVHIIGGLSFKSRVVGVLTPTAAAELGLLRFDPDDPFGPRRVWFAERGDGRFDYASAWPIVGAFHAGWRWRIFGNGTTALNLVEECIRLDEPRCELKPGHPRAKD